MNNSGLINLIIQIKWTNSLKDTIYQNSQEEKDNLNRPVSIKEIESIMNNFPKQKAPGQDRVTGEFYQTLKEEIIPILYCFFQKVQAEEILPNLFYESNITFISKHKKTLQEKKNYRSISLMNRDVKIFKNTRKLNTITCKKNYTPFLTRVYSRYTG